LVHEVAAEEALAQLSPPLPATPSTVAICGYSFTVYLVLVVVVVDVVSSSSPRFSATNAAAAATATALVPVAIALPFAPKVTKGAPQELEAPNKASATNTGHSTFFIKNPLFIGKSSA
jgi:hypothetical protein